MKKIAIGMLFGLLLSIALPAFAAQLSLVPVTYPVYVNGVQYQDAENPVLNYNGRTYIPLAKIADLLNTKYLWNESAKQVEIGSATPAVETPWTIEQLKAAENNNKLIVVLGQAGPEAKIYAYEKTDGVWKQTLMTDGFVGRNGISSSKAEGDGETPAGLYSLSTAFGTAPDPGSIIPYTQLTKDDFWVDDVNSKYYNQWAKGYVSDKDWTSAEDLSSETVAYKYSMLIEYNTNPIVKGKGSAIFLHCSTGRATAGCVSVPEDKMVELLKFIDKDTKIIIAQAVRDLVKF